jgi:hypothetical protein
VRKRRTYRHRDLSRESATVPSLEENPHGVSFVPRPDGTIKVRCRGTGCTFSIDGLRTILDTEEMARSHTAKVS